MALHDALRRGQTDAQAAELVRLVQALERLEQLVCAAHVETRTVVAHAEVGLTVRLAGEHPDVCLRCGGGVFPGVVQQVLQQGIDQRRIG